MFCTRLRILAAIAFIAGAGVQNTWARGLQDFRITLPKRSELTPVQRLNREGVDAIRKHNYEKAEALFYKAYLYDASDPFTLNNLGYVSELKGNLDRAQQFYALASEQGSNANIDLSNSRQLEGKPMMYALKDLRNLPMRVNRMNVEAIQLLSQDRSFEADLLLQKTLALEPDNPFTLNNLGVAEEATGDSETALKYYDEAAGMHSAEPVVVTLQRSWRGKPVSEMAADSAKLLRKRMQNVSTADARATMLTFRGVAATNRNDWGAAKQDFIEASSLDPASAFSLNNLGYVAEKNGDLETAQFYYSKARQAENADVRIGLATQSSAEGKHLLAVAAQSGLEVDNELEQYSQAARRQTGPIELIPRGGTPPNSGPSPAKSSPSPDNLSAPVLPNSGPQVPPIAH